MTRKCLAMLLVPLFLLTLAGCAVNGHYDPARSAAAGGLGGAAMGAALGSIIGAATGDAATGAWVGAATGALVGSVGGYLYARHMDSQVRSANVAAQTYNYTPAQGSVLTIEKVDVTPTKVSPGGQVNMVTSYTVLTPENYPTPVNIVRQVQYGGRPVAEPNRVQVTKTNGTYVDQIAFTVPRGANPGTYTLLTRVSTDRAVDQKSTYFIVE